MRYGKSESESEGEKTRVPGPAMTCYPQFNDNNPFYGQPASPPPPPSSDQPNILLSDMLYTGGASLWMLIWLLDAQEFSIFLET
jgi:hypothetical protein